MAAFAATDRAAVSPALVTRAVPDGASQDSGDLLGSGSHRARTHHPLVSFGAPENIWAVPAGL